MKMQINDFIKDFTELFDDTDPSEITQDTKFHELEEWSSLVAMGLIALAKTEYGKTISGLEMKQCVTVKDLFSLILSK